MYFPIRFWDKSVKQLADSLASGHPNTCSADGLKITIFCSSSIVMMASIAELKIPSPAPGIAQGFLCLLALDGITDGAHQQSAADIPLTR